MSFHDALVLSLNTFFDQIEEMTGISAPQLLELWKSPPKVSSKSSKKEVSSEKSEKKGCVYVFQKGSRPGEQCGKTAYSAEASYCTGHKKYEGEESKKPSSILSEAKAMAASAIKPVGKPVSAVVRVTKNSYGNYEHKATGFVLNPDKKVFGKQVGEKIMLLTQNDLLSCKHYGLAYIPEAVAPLESTEPTEEESEVPDQDEDLDE